MAQWYPGIRQHVSSRQSLCCCKGVATPTSIFGNVAQDHQDHRFPAHQETQRPTLYCTVQPKECEGESAKAEHHGSGIDFCVGFPLQEDCMLYGKNSPFIFPSPHGKGKESLQWAVPKGRKGASSTKGCKPISLTLHKTFFIHWVNLQLVCLVHVLCSWMQEALPMPVHRIDHAAYRLDYHFEFHLNYQSKTMKCQCHTCRWDSRGTWWGETLHS